MQPNKSGSALECRDWSHQEQGEIDRVRAACVEHPNLSLEAGLTDEGDPWCIVYDREREQVIFHLARIDHSYVVVKPESRCKRTATMGEAMNVVISVLAHRQRPTRRANS